MRLAILSDIHGNVLALDAVLADLAAQGGADAVVIAGDLCLDGPRPREVIERLQVLGYPVVQGNTDHDLAHAASDNADDWHGQLFNWTREQIGASGIAYLAALPFSHQVADPTGETAVLVVHANPRDRDTHLRPLAPEETIQPLLSDLPREITTVAFGHLHIPYTRRVGGRLLANIASVGLPKDGDRRASYGVLWWQGDGWGVEQRRVEYAVDEVVAQLRAADPPGAPQLIRQLLRARYPNMAAARGGRQATPRAADAPAAPRPPRANSRPPVQAPVVSSPPTAAPSPPVVAPPLAAPAAEMLADAVVAEIGVPEPLALPVAVAASQEPADESAKSAAKAEKKAAKAAAKKAKRMTKNAPQLTFEATDSFPAILPTLLGERLDAVIEPMETVREDEDPEGVHDMRVGIRRLRGALEPAEPFYPPKDFKRTVRRVKALARALGRVRDADVHLIALRKRLAKVAHAERAGIEGLIDGIIADRAIARADLDPYLDQWDGHGAAHAAELRLFITRAKGRKHKDRRRDSVAAVALQALTARLEALSAIVPVLSASESGDPEALHEVRIVAKQLRYVLEIFSPVLGPDIGELLAELKTLQDLLGELHDRDVLADLLHQERTTAAERELDALDRSAFESGPRDARLDSVRAQLAAPDGFASTAIGIYGLLIDTIDERTELEAAARERWATLGAAGFLERLWALTDLLRQSLVEPEPPATDVADPFVAT